MQLMIVNLVKINRNADGHGDTSYKTRLSPNARERLFLSLFDFLTFRLSDFADFADPSSHSSPRTFHFFPLNNILQHAYQPACQRGSVAY